MPKSLWLKERRDLERDVESTVQLTFCQSDINWIPTAARAAYDRGGKLV